ncbi:hypothetical protein ACWCPJ_01120, partial [Streptomyces collinus]
MPRPTHGTLTPAPKTPTTTHAGTAEPPTARAPGAEVQRRPATAPASVPAPTTPTTTRTGT